ncbi:MAG TPA: AbrB/MazE/SpoVT family DNA-binding domain-containing protein [Armatimonadota bacterium]|nr:AbrB/MazE/SpoVT family DNA-binding domain-containing protein [Armatimonadota bacterium]
MPSSRMIRVSSKGQIVLPKSLREKVGIDDGDYIIIEEIDGILLIEKPTRSRLSMLTEKLRGRAASQAFKRQDLEEAIAEVRAQKRT